MSQLDAYLTEHFLNANQFAAKCNVSVEELDELVQSKLIPGPSYTVTDNSTVCSFVFGEMETHNSTPGHYFRPEAAIWVTNALEAIKAHGPNAATEIKRLFAEKYKAALADINAKAHRLPHYFATDGTPIKSGLDEQTELVWEHFLKGTFGLCVAKPVSEEAIARKGVLQQQLTKQTNNGSRTQYSPSQAEETRALIDRYVDASMPFSPVEYHLSSRKRLVHDVLALLNPT